MAVTVRIPAVLRGITQGAGEVECTSPHVRGLLTELESRYPGMKDRLCEPDGQVRRFVNVYVNREDIRFLQGLNTPLKDGDVVSIVPAIAGG